MRKKKIKCELYTKLNVNSTQNKIQTYSPEKDLEFIFVFMKQFGSSNKHSDMCIMPTSMYFSNVHTPVLLIHEPLHITSQNNELVKANYNSYKNINRTKIKEEYQNQT
jgi:hypothetical protein